MNTNSGADDPSKGDQSHDAGAVKHIVAALTGLRYGVVTVIVQDGVVVQIERTQRTRLRGK